MTRTAAIDGGEWTGALFAPVVGGARLSATPRRDRAPSSAAPRGGGAFAALVSLVVHMAIVVVAALSFEAPRPTGAPEAIAVELVASTGEIAPAADAESGPAAPEPRSDASAVEPALSPPPPPAEAEPALTSARQAAASAATLTTNVFAPPAPIDKTAAERSSANAEKAPADALPALDPNSDPPNTAAASVATPPPTVAAARPPEADFVAPQAAPHVEAMTPATPRPAERARMRPKPWSAAPGARAASAATPARSASELAAYRDALLAKIRAAVRYPEAARERGAIGVATVRFTLDGLGAVTLVDLAQSSGDRALDDEAVTAVRRASPLPPPPPGPPLAYSAPIRFVLR